VLLTRQTGTHRSNRSDPPVRPVWHCCSTVFDSSVLTLWINQGTQWFPGEPPETPRTRCSLRQSPLMTRLPRSPSLTLVLRLNQETVHDFILLFMPPCCPHLTPLATGSLEQSLLVFSTPGGLTGNDRDKTKLKQRAQTTKPKLEQPLRAPPATCKLPLNQCMKTT
jgi:hypothetical protein